MKNALIHIMTFIVTIAIGFFMCYTSIVGYFKFASVSSEITTFCLGFLLIILSVFSGAEIIFKSLKNK